MKKIITRNVAKSLLMKKIDIPMIENQKGFCSPIICTEENLGTQRIIPVVTDETEEVLKENVTKFLLMNIIDILVIENRGEFCSPTTCREENESARQLTSEKVNKFRANKRHEVVVSRKNWDFSDWASNKLLAPHGSAQNSIMCRCKNSALRGWRRRSPRPRSSCAGNVFVEDAEAPPPGVTSVLRWAADLRMIRRRGVTVEDT